MILFSVNLKDCVYIWGTDAYHEKRIQDNWKATEKGEKKTRAQTTKTTKEAASPGVGFWKK